MMNYKFGSLKTVQFEAKPVWLYGSLRIGIIFIVLILENNKAPHTEN
ncbi:MAG: hypothetical protein ACI9T9_001154 [Oleiphilaceae bacterium]|jgi:hypothetical protein